MSAPGSRTFLCSCNGSLPLPEASPALDQALGRHQVERAQQLCRREVTRLDAALAGTQDILVGCTQEAPLFSELAQVRQAIAPIRFVNLREQAGWGREGQQAGPKIAALVEMASRELVDPVASVSYASEGRLLVVGEDEAALDWAERLHEAGQSLPEGRLQVSFLLVGQRHELRLQSRARHFPVLSGAGLSLQGWLGDFKAKWQLANPIDLEACVRCGACIEACPSQAIGPDFQVDLSRCDARRACVKACAGIGAIDFLRGSTAREETFDLVLDLREEGAAPLFTQFHPPQGYHRPGVEPQARLRAMMTLLGQVGEFEKPKYFHYQPQICAHGRNRRSGCTQCIDVCSTQAISSAGDRIQVEPHLCMGCGACATVCPSGALRYQYPTPAALGERVRHGLKVYRQLAGTQGRPPTLLFCDEGSRAALEAPGPGLAAHLLPVFVRDVASIGLDLMLATLAWGAGRVVCLFAADAPPAYVEATRTQIRTLDHLLGPLAHPNPLVAALQLGENGQALTAALTAIGEGVGTGAPRASALRLSAAATFALPPEKRRATEAALQHLVRHAASGLEGVSGKTPVLPEWPDAVALPAGSAFGRLRLDPERCTLCLACVGACPEGAVLDGQQAGEDRPQLRFLERNCVQCGLCDKTCPEQAIALQPRWWFGPERDQQVVLHEASPYHCISCGKAFGTQMMIENMLSKLSGHSAFAGAAAQRLKMCADCRVIDLYSSTNEATIHDVRRGE